MKLTHAIQELCLAILLYDDSVKGAAHIAAVIPPKEFDSYYRDLAESADNFRRRFNTVPGEHALDLVNTLKEQHPDAADIYDKIYRSLESVKDGINREYVVDQAQKFARRQRVKRGITKAIDLMQTDQDEDIDAAQGVLESAFKSANQLFDPGVILANTDRSLGFLNKDEEEAFPTGVKELDMLGLGPRRKQQWLLIAPYNKGKSWACIHVGKNALRAKKRVLHLSLEMSEEEVAKRYVQSIFAVSKRDEKVLRMKFEVNELGQAIEWDQIEVENKNHLNLSNIRSVLVDKIKIFRGASHLIIKQFPTGMLTIAGLKAYLDSLESACGFIPDELILDYPDLMDVDAGNHRHAIGKIYQQLRGIAVERNFAEVVVTQGNRATLSARTTTGGMVSEDISKLATADTAITYSQTDTEYEFGMARLFVDKARDEVKNFSVLISQAYKIGQFCLESARMNSTYFKKIDEEEAAKRAEANKDD